MRGSHADRREPRRLCGASFGLIYGSVIPTVQKWFPDRKAFE